RVCAQGAECSVCHAEAELSISSKGAEKKLGGNGLRQACRTRDYPAHCFNGPRNRRRDRRSGWPRRVRCGAESTDDEQNRTRWKKPERESNGCDDRKCDQKKAALTHREMEQRLNSHSRRENRQTGGASASALTTTPGLSGRSGEHVATSQVRGVY